MIIKSSVNTVNKKLKIDKNNVDVSFNNIKDSVILSAKTKASHALRTYKALKKEQTKDKGEPWWGEAVDAFHVQGDVVTGFKMPARILNASSIGSAVGAVGLGILGAMEIKEGIREKDRIKVIGGASAVFAGVASGADATLNTIESNSLFGTAGSAIAKSAGMIGSAFGVTHGVIDIGLGANQLIKGIETKNKDAIVDGSLNMAIGSTMIMVTLGSTGPIGAVALGGLFLGKLIYDHRKIITSAGKKL